MNSSLSQIPLFKGVPFESIEKLTQNFSQRNFKRGELLIEQGTKAIEMFLILEGKIETFYLSKEGEKTTIIYHEAPFITGEIELFEERKYLANVIALEPCRTLIVTRKQFLNLLQSNHQVCINLARVLSYLLCETGEDRRVKFFGRVKHLLANLICYQAQLYGKETSYGILIQKEVNKKDIATSLGVARKSVIEAFKQLEKEGLIHIDAKQVIIPDLRILQTKARDL